MMRWTLFFLIFAATLQSCGYKEKEAELAKREQQITEKEQTLMQWEQRLTLLEKELQEKKKKQQQDSTAVTDSLQAQPVTGKWIVKMRCTETNCSGSAIGDSKTETWEIAYQNKGIVVNTFTGNELSRIYNGSFTQTRLEATNGQPGSESMMRILLELKDGKMEGTREVERTDCKIRYTLTAERPK
ncbi:hypothetical protein [Dyadobacter fanqingshengii]|uniref:Uncharacterized protein n=1 Tax=Dyadobacter fanqingshengii TaxID=2906443 RepID=A0A9X1PE33_9BACT|nr:hypothetical protein [Dyadobacter fanqingshengii]MCF0041993.1 hypothetical protein [Dyadobacter fanqingshengii]USJ36303.1 hypothetical protein NFI81_00715 [Dyadobacter fanqingshengii]